MQDQLYDMLVSKNELTWQNIIYELVRTEQMDPWDIDVGILAKRYLETIREMQELNFFISGKVILASAILLKIKSDKLVEEELARFDDVLFHREEEAEDLLDFVDDNKPKEDIDVSLIPKTPHTRRRRVSMEDLIKALKKALEVDKRRVIRRLREEEVKVEIPEVKVNITKVIKEVYDKVKSFLSKKEKLMFSELIESTRREDKIATFVPLLHLTTQQKIDLYQEEHFGDIEIMLLQKT